MQEELSGSELVPPECASWYPQGRAQDRKPVFLPPASQPGTPPPTLVKEAGGVTWPSVL